MQAAAGACAGERVCLQAAAAAAAAAAMKLADIN